MDQKPMNNTFDPQTLADDLLEVRRIYTEFFTTLDETRRDKPVKAGSKEWTLHETVAHQCALNGAGLESIKRDASHGLGQILQFSLATQPQVWLTAR